MDPYNKHQVSLRGASTKEISREALLEKVSQERELRNYARRATASAIFIQSVWRCYSVTKKVAVQLQEEWVALVNCHASLITGSWISSVVLRPFLFFVTRLSTQHQKIQTRDIDCMQKCFKILLDSINSSDSRKNFCSLTTGTLQERRTWNYQAKKLISLCSFILAHCDKSHAGSQCIVGLTILALRFLVVLTDLKVWKSLSNDMLRDADTAMKNLLWFMGSRNSHLYMSIRRYIDKLDITYSSQINSTVETDERFLITASAVTLALRPFHITNFDVSSIGQLDMCCAAEQYCLCLLTIPWFIQRLPAFLIPALKHQSILSPCFQIFLIRRDKMLSEMLKMDQSDRHDSQKAIPPIGWALTNIICLATGSENGFVDTLDHPSYVQVVITLAENLLAWVDNVGWVKEKKDLQGNVETSAAGIDAVLHDNESLNITYMELFRPVCQQWHLMKLLEIAKTGATSCAAANDKKYLGKLELLDIAYFYSYMLRIFSVFNPMVGSLPVLNLLSFTPGYLLNLWGELENSIFPENGHIAEDNCLRTSKSLVNKKDGILDKRQKQTSKDGANKLVNALHKFTGKSQAGPNYTDTVDGQVDEESSDVWTIESLRYVPQGISKDLSCLLHLFCAAYSHLLLVLDDIEFYEKQVPFTLEQQRRIAAMLNTLVYNGLNHDTGHQNRPLMDSAIRCLHMMYERDCRHQFCPRVLWLSPAKRSRPPIAVAARTHEVLSANMRSDESLTVSSLGSVVTTTPHVFPFEERVEMFREFISMDKVSRKIAGDVAGPGSRSIEIVVRRGHIVEDGFRQLNSLGSRLKSSIHVSFVSECGLPEAGLDYGGLSKEFLTDISKSAFAPEYGLFSQTSTSDRLLIPNAAARYLENGIQMFEFLGRVVGKALYEGILLDYAFSHVFVQKLLGRYSFLDELSTLDPELYRNLI
ncbi:E3 ubiquitin-protein ligase UPL7 isoform X4 [Citrus sinensis]|uniref:E3 ubiquitin-protein ligase UPL7 isoform X4 n=1 Tax=Citrus sinensis TaxID=2711 RepID=UPI0003D7379D|nr:E3 ubiquitin-protein ligase UPL7 isoform X4 [Citrus sinensis]